MLVGKCHSEKRTVALGSALAVATVIAIAFATLGHGDPAVLQATPLTCLVCGDHGGVDVWRNVVLFTPLGVGLALAGARVRHAAVVGLLLSLTIETLQHTVLIGRDATLSDLLTNTLGTAIGAAGTHHWRSWVVPAPAAARKWLLGGALLWTGLLAGVAVGLRWDPAPPPYHANQLPPHAGTMRPFEGRVVSATVDGRPVGGADDARSVRGLTQGGVLHLAAVVEPAYPPGKLRPIIWFFDAEWDEVLTFGQRGRALVLRAPTRSVRVRLLRPTFVLEDAFPPDARRVAVSAVTTPRSVTLQASHGAVERRAHIEKSLALGWTMFHPWSWSAQRLAPLLAAAWLAAPAFVLAYWAGMSADSRRSRPPLPLAAAAAIALLPVCFNAAYGLAPLPPACIAALVLAGAAGWGLGRLVRRRAAACACVRSL